MISVDFIDCKKLRSWGIHCIDFTYLYLRVIFYFEKKNFNSKEELSFYLTEQKLFLQTGVALNILKPKQQNAKYRTI